MKNEELLKVLIKELMGLNELHQEYQDNDTHFVIDSQKEGNTLNIKIQLIENKDKEEFEKWLETVDDKLFEEVLDALSKEGLKNIEDLYNSPNYKEVINKVKAKTKQIASKKIKEFQKLISQ